ncbi:MAG: hypothetical protein ACRDTM_07805 [Micromonosporaceae bacterium]
MGGTLGSPGQHGNPWGAPDQGAPWHVPESSPPYQPQPYPAQPQWAATPAPPTPPTPKRSNPRWWIGGIAGFVVLALGCTLLAALFTGGDGGARFEDPAKRQARLSGEALAAAASALSQDAAVRYAGSYTDGDDEIAVTAQITNDGWLSAKLTVDDTDVAVLSNGTRSYVKAPKAYWTSHGAPRDTVGDYAKRWVLVPADDLGIDLSLLAPGAFGSDLAALVQRGEVAGGAVSKIDGTAVREVLTPDVTAYVTTAEPHRVVRIAAPKERGGMSPSGRRHGWLRPAYAPETPDEFEFDVTGLSEEEVVSLFDELEKRVQQLKTSIDSQVTFSLGGGITLSPCTVAGCVANVTISNRVSSSSPYAKIQRSVRATVTISFTLDGAPVGRPCRIPKTMKPNGSATVRCGVSYVVPRDGRTHRVVATAHTVAAATVTADIKRMFDDLRAERARGKPKPPGKDADLGGKWMPRDPKGIPDDKGGCEKCAADIQKRIGGEIKTITQPHGGGWMGPYRGYDTPWKSHVVVVKNGRVYDAWTSRYGEPIDVYKSRWAYGDVLKFGF